MSNRNDSIGARDGRNKENMENRGERIGHPPNVSDRHGRPSLCLTERHTQIQQGEYPVKNNLMLTISSMLSILFMTFHLAQDTLHARVGTAEAGGSTLIGVPILVVWLFGPLVLAERRSGHIIMLVGSIFAMGMPVIHVMGAAGVFHVDFTK